VVKGTSNKGAILLAALLSLAMLLSACSGGGTQTSATQPADSAATQAQTSESAAPAQTDEGAAGDVTELIWLMGDPGTIPADQARVEEELNKISEEKLGVRMKTIYYKDESVKLALSAGEEWDIAFTCEWYNNYAVQAAAGYFADLTEKIKTVTPDLYATMPDVVWEGAKVSGKIFAIPVKKDYAAEMFAIFDKALYEDLGMEITPTMDWYDLDKYLKAAKEAFEAGNPLAKGEYPAGSTYKAGFEGPFRDYDMINRDIMIGIPYSAVGTPDENKVIFVPTDPVAFDMLKVVHRWFEEGYIPPDAMTLESVPPTTWYAVSCGQGFYGADAIWSGGVGYPVEISRFSGPYLSTASIRGAMNAINAKSKNIDLALKYQELVNTDQTYRDILRYGIEGTHWNKTAEGLAQRTDEGRSGYQPWPFSQGSYSLSTVEAAEGVSVDPDMWNVIFDGYKDAVATNSIGFSFDPVNVETELAACAATYKKYLDGLVTGTTDPETEVPRLLDEMNASGLEKVIAECQAQLDAFVANK
jgi:putative aldouronate transport system substrate-binding protein